MAFLCVSARADPATDRLREAVNLARASDWDAAVATLPATINLDRSHLPLLWDAAAALRGERPGAALHLLAAMRRLDGDAVRPQTALEALWAEQPAPAALDAADVPFLPVDVETTALPASADGPGMEIVTLTPKPFVALAPVVEARSGASYEHLATVYARNGPALGLRVVVHFPEGVKPGLARRVGRFLGAVSEAATPLLGPASRAAFPVPVWLSALGSAGAEQWAGAIVIHRANDARSPLEWARELAHEWGHASLPGVDGFHSPEAWANGDLGERLFLPVLAKRGWLAAWGEPIDAAPYARRFVDPLRAAFARTGPVPALVRGNDRAAYDHFLGAALYVSSTYGTPALMDALDGMEGDRPADFLASFRRILATKATWTVHREGPLGPRPICIPAAGRYMLVGHGVRYRTRPASAPLTLPAGWTMAAWDGDLTVRRR